MKDPVGGVPVSCCKFETGSNEIWNAVAQV